jgi:hypothetical protein
MLVHDTLQADQDRFRRGAGAFVGARKLEYRNPQ